MKIRIEIVGTEPLVREGAYVYDTGDLGGTDLYRVLSEMEAYILRSLKELRKLQLVGS
jgi:hypothetical protein